MTSIVEFQIQNNLKDIDMSLKNYILDISPDGKLNDNRLIFQVSKDITKKFITGFTLVNQLPNGKIYREDLRKRNICFSKLMKRIIKG